MYRFPSQDGDDVTEGMVGQIRQVVTGLPQPDEVGREAPYGVPVATRGPGPCGKSAQPPDQPIEVVVGAGHAGEANFNGRV